MRFRGKSIRRKIVALLLVPLLSLTAIWAFATVLTGREAQSLFNVSHIVEEVGYPTEDTVRVLQQERRQTLVYLADPRASDSLAALRRSRAATDEMVAKLRRNSKDEDLQEDMGQGTAERLTSILDALDGMTSLRRSVEDGTVNRSQALDLYNRLVDPCFALLANLHLLDNVEMDKQGRALVNVFRARELLSREDALLGSALVAGRLTSDDIHDVSVLVTQRSVMYDVSLPLLPVSESQRFQRYWKNADTAPLRVAEQAVVDAAPGSPHGVTAKSWDGAAGQVLDRLDRMSTQADDRYQDRVRPLAVNVVIKAAIPGVLGLIALLVSLIMSVRIGRALIRDLRRLRLEAHEASGVRLPSVMRRLSAGEQVDIETEVPRLEYDKNEIGEVGQALNTLQRAAVEAAVRQAELRAGVSEVFVNLARRSQVLLHKQLTLLDAMERRTDDTEELADLFRLDHLTTRMRRHAEGLVILSGAAPSRQWRKPIQLMDVVRAAVAEVEDYERIEVRRLPRVAVTGPAVADLTHLVAELLENATVFSPPHTAVQVVGERVANGFTLEIHDRGLGMTAEALMDANLRLAETPEFELSDTDRLGLFVVSRLARRQSVRVSLQPSPYGGTTAVVFIPDTLLTDDVPDTNGIGFRLDRALPDTASGTRKDRASALPHAPVRLPGVPASILDGPIELEAPIDLDALDDFAGALDEQDDEPGVVGPRRSLADTPGEQHQQVRDTRREAARPGDTDHPGAPVPLPRRRAPKLVSSHGRPVAGQGPRRSAADEEQSPPDRGIRGLQEDRRPSGRSGEPKAGAARSSDDRAEVPALPQRRRTRPPSGPDGTMANRDAAAGGADAVAGPLPRRVRQASLAPQLRDGPGRSAEREQSGTADRAGRAERDADEVRSRFASLQRGWQRGREENAAGDEAQDGSARGTTKGDGR
ncbi:nitrate- and nitrite sensing domain-containing protein [Streptomyces sp. Ru72]|uniref:sensor histidine kinase n=1 Tax=Streptomyces sp. Ru72 TaxID=2080747 RepID=UPI000CDD53C5|nr:nitrate- and nitrite sensing domain-containing protein [Streptomyces sp. Ru72]POX43916.1 histidine kinase [Streptomyces sp. Ru72]